jgi:hypothetical protein
MRTSTLSRWILLLFLLGWALPAYAQRPSIAIAPFGHTVPNIRTGLAAQLWRELNGSGRYEVADNAQVAALLAGAQYDAAQAHPSAAQIASVAGCADYLLVVRVLAFDVVDRESLAEFNSDMRDLGALIVGQDKAAYAAFDTSLYETESGFEVARFTLEGIESKHGVRMKQLTLGWLGSVDLDSDEFRRTNIGIATYKALGEAMRGLYAHFPLHGTVLAVSGDSLVLDLDERCGLMLGDELTIVRQQSIANKAGEPVWEDELRVGSCKVVEIKTGRSLCLILDGLGAIQEGDTVKPMYESIVVPQETNKAE